MTWSCVAVKKPSVSANKSALVSHLFDASMSTYCWLSSNGCRPCKAFWDHCLLTSLVHSSSVASSLLLLLLLLLLFDGVRPSPLALRQLYQSQIVAE
jgi:hypothetical protein